MEISNWVIAVATTVTAALAVMMAVVKANNERKLRKEILGYLESQDSKEQVTNVIAKKLGYSFPEVDASLLKLQRKGKVIPVKVNAQEGFRLKLS